MTWSNRPMYPLGNGRLTIINFNLNVTIKRKDKYLFLKLFPLSSLYVSCPNSPFEQFFSQPHPTILRHLSDESLIGSLTNLHIETSMHPIVIPINKFPYTSISGSMMLIEIKPFLNRESVKDLILLITSTLIIRFMKQME